MPISVENFTKQLSHPEFERNICILAHVDHGKTSLSDCLLASNGIISQTMQGKIRFLDSRPDEQLRGITMESSAISLYFKVAKKQIAGQDQRTLLNEYVINLIDSPGHIDFSSEVSTASRLCDGAIVVVDVVEGVCSQTVTVLRQCWDERLKPILLINKIDRLILDLRLSASEAYIHLCKLIEQVNAVVGSFFAGQRMEEDFKWRQQQELGGEGDQVTEFNEASDEDLYFSPQSNNVIFGSAIDGWGFNLKQFANIYESKLGIPSDELVNYLFGDNYYNAKTKKIIQGAHNLKNKSSTAKPLFVQLILENIWAVYLNVITDRNQEKVEKIVAALNIKLLPKDLKSKDSRVLLTNIFNQWIPMSRSVLLSVIDKLSSPVDAQKERMSHILETTPGFNDIDQNVVDSMTKCDMSGPPVAFISKLQAIPISDIPVLSCDDDESSHNSISRFDRDIEQLRLKSQKARDLALAVNNENSDDTMFDELKNLSVEQDSPMSKQVMIGFGRVFSGTLEVGQKLNCLGPRYHPKNPTEFCTEITINGLYLFMGRDLLAINKAPAGSIVGIGGLDGKILKSGTLVSQNLGGPNLASTNNIVHPILRVALEPVDATKMFQMEEGLKLLNISDPCVQVTIQENGEHILATAGELHLERCIKDLREKFAKCEITYSKPIVPFRETILSSDHTSSNENTGIVQGTIGNYRIKFLVESLPEPIINLINEHADRIRGFIEGEGREEEDEICLVETSESEMLFFKQKLSDLLISSGKKFSIDDIVSLGPKRIGPNILFDRIGLFTTRLFSEKLTRKARVYFEDSINTSFQLAMNNGPLCGEPLEGIAVSLIEAVQEENEGEGEKEGQSDGEEGKTQDLTEKWDNKFTSSGQGRIVPIIKDLFVQGIAQWPTRLKIATYLCDIQTTSEALGKVYGVISKRRGKILTEEMKEGTPFFTIHASIPVIESFGFSEEIRKRTSGAANPQLVFSGFELLAEDPFWVPSTEEELEELGELADKENIALSYMNSIRRRKGLPVHAKLIENSERQRTLKR